MKQIYFTPGPAQLYPTLEEHIQTALEEQIGSISHRSKQFEEIFSSCVQGLRQLLHLPDTYHIFFVGSGTEAMERTIQNCVRKHSFHFVNGSFSKRFYDIASELGKTPHKQEVALGEGFDFSSIHIPHHTELICMTHNETSSGVMIPESMIHAVAKKHPETLMAVDSVSSAPYGNLDYSLLDVVFFSVQKGFGLPSGMGVMIVSPRALQKAQRLKNTMPIGSYHTFIELAKWAEKNQTPETPSVLHIYLLDRIIHDMNKKGITTLKRHIDNNAQKIYSFLDASTFYSAGVTDTIFRSPTVIVVNVNDQQKKLLAYLQKHHVIVGTGYGPKKDTQIRIANFPAHSSDEIKKLMQLLQTFYE